MDFTISPTITLVVVCCVVLPLMGAMIFTFFVPVTLESLLDFFYFKILDHESAKEVEAEQKFQAALSQKGMVAEAKILSIRSLGRKRKLRKEPHQALVEYDVEVMPENMPAFKAAFQHWLTVYDRSGRFGADVIGDAIREEMKQKIYVIFDPNDPSQIMHSHYEKDHPTILRMIEFNKITKGNEELKRVGEQAEAIITLAEDLNLPYPAKNSRAMRLEFKVTPQSGADFSAGGDHLIGDKALNKYSVGKRVFVRFDPQNPKWAVLDSERNKSL